MRAGEIEVRPAQESDLDGVTALATQVQTLHTEGRPDLFRPAAPDELRSYLSGCLSDGAILLVAEHTAEGLVGYVLAEAVRRPASPFQHPHTSLYVHHIAVDGSARRQGIGDLLLQKIVEVARREGAASIRLDSWSFNTGAHRFFEVQGFAPMRVVFERAVLDSPPGANAN
ncbi:MAG: GNAT family N-acetyltransferase [Arachnia sp.]